MQSSAAVKITAALLLTFTTLAAKALVVTIEPDDYVAETDLSDISPYVKLRDIYFDGLQVVEDPVKARYRENAPTGNLTFGNAALYTFNDSSCMNDTCWAGFGMFFNQEISGASLLAQNIGHPQLNIRWAAFDQSGNKIGDGTTSTSGIGETVLVDVQLQGIWSLIIGGDDGIAAIDFDQLVFDTSPSVEISEPGMLSLLTLALLVMLPIQRKR